MKTAGFPDVMMFPPTAPPTIYPPAFIELKALPEVPVDTAHRFSINWASPSQPITLMSLAVLGMDAGALVRYGVTDPKEGKKSTLCVWAWFRARPTPLWVQAVLKPVDLKGDDSEAVYPDGVCVVRPGEDEVAALKTALRQWFPWPWTDTAPGGFRAGVTIPRYADWRRPAGAVGSFWHDIQDGRP